MKQTLHGMNGLDSPTAGYNINSRQELNARTWLLWRGGRGSAKSAAGERLWRKR